MYLQFLLTDAVTRLLPRKCCYGISRLVSDFIFRRERAGCEAVMCNLRQIKRYLGQSVSDDELHSMAMETFRNFGKYMVDFFWFSGRRAPRLTKFVDIPDRSPLDRIGELGRGAIGVTAHLGNWESGAVILSSMGIKVNAVVLPMANNRVNRLFQSRRSSRGINVIMLGNAGTEIVAALRRAEMVVILGDRDYTGRSYEFKFMGAPAHLPLGPARLCRITRSPILPGFLVRTSDDRFLMKLYEPIVPSAGDDWKTIELALGKILEDGISQYPTQWFIFDRFWKSV